MQELFQQKSLCSKTEAKKRSLQTYFTGKPCSRNHIAERYTSNSVCVQCNTYHAKERWKKNSYQLKQKNKEWRHANSERIYNKNKEWKIKNPNKVKRSSKSYYEKNKERLKSIRQAYRNANKEKINKYVSDWQKTNRHKKNKTRNEWRKQKLKNDPFFAAIQKIRQITIDAFRRGLLKKSKTTENLLGCSVLDAKLHIESQFLNGMSWKNHGQWHIDHIIPLASAKTVEDVVRLCHYTNLQPLWAKDNLKKGAKIL